MSSRLRDIAWLMVQLGVSKQVAYRLLREGIVPSVRLGRSVRVSEDAFHQFIQEGGRGLINDESQLGSVSG